MNTDESAVDAGLEALQRDTFRYFLLWTNPQNGLVLDKTAPDWPASIAATGLALAATEATYERFKPQGLSVLAVFINDLRDDIAAYGPRAEIFQSRDGPALILPRG